ncbi:MAG: coenzyme F420-0:L-glutamate ligase [Geodermatophilaceae bacterium]|nr:coenzyme F420-0:L-glutamate ligase [Geodermatophilaceae bacterium]
MSVPVPDGVQILPIAGLPELRPGDDLASLLCAAAPWLLDGDILVVTSKAVSKVEGRLVPAPLDPAGREQARQKAVEAETARVVAQRGATRIVVTHHGWVMAAAGVDASNIALGELALLPVDADASARALREAIAARAGVRVAVVISDTMGRTWRRGLTDNAIGVAGMGAVADLRGLPDTSGIPLEVTEVAVADEIAAAADLVKGKLSGLPAAVVRGLRPPVDDGNGSTSLRRPVAEDMFSLGTRDVVGSRRAATGFGPGQVPFSVLRSSIETALRVADLINGLDLLPDNPWRAAGYNPESQPMRLLQQAAAVIVPFLTDGAAGADDEPSTRLGMAISALLIQLHAEGFAAAWLSPGQIADLRPVMTPQGARPHGLVVVGQIER